MCPGFDSDRFVDDVALNAGCGCEADFQPAHATNNTTIYDNVVCNNFALDNGPLANCQQMCADVALDGAFDLNVARGFQVALYGEVC